MIMPVLMPYPAVPAEPKSVTEALLSGALAVSTAVAVAALTIVLGIALVLWLPFGLAARP